MIRARSLTKEFGDTAVLRGLDFSVEAGEFTSLLGLSGAGKTTLLRCMNGLNDITSGELIVSNHDVGQRKNLRRLRREVGMIFQHFNLVGRLSALQNVLTGFSASTPTWRSLFGLYQSADVDYALNCLQRVGLREMAYRRADTLSGGEKQRVAIARALVQRPKVILADEPVSSVDPKVGQQIMELLQKIAKEDGITVVCNLHNVEFAKSFADRVMGMANGVIVFDGKPEDLTQDDVERIYIFDKKLDHGGETADVSEAATQPANDDRFVRTPNGATVRHHDDSYDKTYQTIKYLALGALIIAVLAWSAIGSEINIYTLVNGWPFIVDIVSRMLPPDTEKLPRLIGPTIETLQIAIWGTILGIVLAAPIGLLAARNITPHYSVYWVARALLNMARGISELVFALIFVSAVGLGPFPGVLALAIHNAGMLGKFYGDVIEGVDPGPIDALHSTGANQLQVIRWAIFPQVMPDFVSFNLYRFEVSVRAATVLGLVGAGGIGFPLLTSMRLFRYQETTTILIMIVLMVAVTDFFAGRIRRKII